jgi:hypothetical protein
VVAGYGYDLRGALHRGLDAATLARRASVAAVRRELRGVGLDGRRVAAISEVRAGGERTAAVSLVPGAAPVVVAAPEMPTDDELARMERDAGLVVGAA